MARIGCTLAIVCVVGCVDETVSLPLSASEPDRGRRPGRRDLGGPSDTGVDTGSPDLGAPDAEPVDGGLDLGGPDLGGPDLGLDAGVARRDASFEMPAEDPVYVHGSRTLFEFDLDRRRAERIADFDPPRVVTDIAIDRTGRMVAVSGTGLYDVQPSTGRMQFLAQMERDAIGLTFLPDGSLVAAGGPHVWVADVDDGRTVRTLVQAQRLITSGDVVALPDGMIYWSVGGTGPEVGDRIIRIDPQTGELDDLGSVGVLGVWGLAYADGELYGFTSGGRQLTIEIRADGLRVQAGSAPGDWWGATTNPVLWD